MSLAGNRPPEKPKFQRDQSAALAFNGTVAERHTAADGSAEYLHLIFGTNEFVEGRGANVVDAEFLFLKGESCQCSLTCAQLNSCKQVKRYSLDRLYLSIL